MREYWLDPPEPPEYPPCPCCGSDSYESLIVGDEEIVGCSDCLMVKDAGDYWAEKAEEAKEAYEDMLYCMKAGK